MVKRGSNLHFCKPLYFSRSTAVFVPVIQAYFSPLLSTIFLSYHQRQRNISTQHRENNLQQSISDPTKTFVSNQHFVFLSSAISFPLSSVIDICSPITLIRKHLWACHQCGNCGTICNVQLYTPSLEPTIRVVVGGNIEQGRIIPRDKEFCRNKRNIARLRNYLNMNFHLVFELPFCTWNIGQGSLRDFLGSKPVP